MSVSPRDFLREARKIALDVNQETSRRRASSTAYYAAFHGAKRFHGGLARPGRSKRDVGEHENLIHQLRNPDSALDSNIQGQSVMIGDLLLKLRPYRVAADYELENEFSAREMNDAIELAAQLLNLTDPK